MSDITKKPTQVVSKSERKMIEACAREHHLSLSQRVAFYDLYGKASTKGRNELLIKLVAFPVSELELQL